MIYSRAEFIAPSIDGDDHVFHNLTVSNRTDKVQNNVDVRIESKFELDTVEIVPSDDNAGDPTISWSEDKKSIGLSIASMRPKEEAAFQVKMRRSEAVFVEYDVSSDESIGELAGQASDASVWDGISKVLPVLFGFLLPVALAMFLFRNRSSIALSSNNTGFCLLHSGELDDASQIFETKIAKSGGGVFELTNYACCLALKGELEKAKRYLSAARLLGGSKKHDNVTLAELIISWKEKDVPSAMNRLTEFREQRRVIFFSPYKSYRHSMLLAEIEADLAGNSPKV